MSARVRPLLVPYRPPPAKVQRKEDSDLRAGNPQCIVCGERVAKIVLLPCAHLLLCLECNKSHEVSAYPTCPECRADVKERIFVFMKLNEPDEPERKRAKQSNEAS